MLRPILLYDKSFCFLYHSDGLIEISITDMYGTGASVAGFILIY